MKHFILSIFVLLSSAFARAGSFYNSTEFYALLGAKADASDLVDAVFMYETNGMNGDRAASMSALDFDGTKEYCEAEKIQLAYRARELRRAYRKDVAKLHKAHLKAKLPDKMKPVGKIKFNPPSIELWAKSELGTNALQAISSNVLDFKGFLEFLQNETGIDSIKPQSVLHRNLGHFSKLTDEEKTVWFYRAQVAMIRLEAENARRDSRRYSAPPRNENGKPPVKPYRATKRN